MKQTLLVAVAVITLLGTTGAAHHSLAAAYRLNDTAMLEGTVVLVAFNEPHTYVHVEALDRDGVLRRWSLQWGDRAALAGQGITRATLRAGDQVRVLGHPGRNPEAYQMLIVHLARAGDEWTWGDEASALFASLR